VIGLDGVQFHACSSAKPEEAKGTAITSKGPLNISGLTVIPPLVTALVYYVIRKVHRELWMVIFPLLWKGNIGKTLSLQGAGCADMDQAAYFYGLIR